MLVLLLAQGAAAQETHGSESTGGEASSTGSNAAAGVPSTTAAASGASALRARVDRLPTDEGTATARQRGIAESLRYQLDIADEIEGRFSEQAAAWRQRVARQLGSAEQGLDPFHAARGVISVRGYPSALSLRTQGYAVYVPPDYDPAVPYPLLVVLHGGSSNGNLFLGVVLGNNMSWEHYRDYLYDLFEPRVFPKAIVVAPDGFGQVMWRWMGEQDVLDVIADVGRHYAIDQNRITLIGLSNGGVGAYAIGNRHAWRFNVVQAIAGAPSWVRYAGGRPQEDERRLLAPLSLIHTPHNIRNTDFRFYHGREDGGPMRPAFVQELETVLERENISASGTWYDAGHDILYRVNQHGRRFDALTQVIRNPSPANVAIETGDYRANRQHWVTVTRLDNYPSIGRVEASATDNRIRVTTRGVRAFALDLDSVPAFANMDAVTIEIDGHEAYRGSTRELGHTLHLRREGEVFRPGFPPDDGEKRKGVSGPLTDAYFGRMIHIFGTLVAADRPILEDAARRGARGFPLWLWRFEQTVIADTELRPEQMRDAHWVLYGNATSNKVLQALNDQLPIHVTAQAVEVGARRFEGPEVGVRFIYPNPLVQDRYLIVQGGPRAEAAQAGHRLPDFLPDYVVYDGRATPRRERLLRARQGTLTAGFFDDQWRLRDEPMAMKTMVPRRTDRIAAPDRFGHPLGAGSRRVPTRPRFPRAPALPQSLGREVERHTRRVDGFGQVVSAAMADEIAMRSLTAPFRRGERQSKQDSEKPPPRADTPVPAHEDAGGDEPAVPERAELPIPPAPRLPPRPTRFLAPADDPSGAVARRIAALIPTFHNYRAEIPGARWRVDPAAAWQIRPEAACHADLAARGVAFRAAGSHPTPVPSPVELLGPVGGIWFRMRHADRPLTISCELATRLHDLATIWQRFGVRGAEVLSAYRDHPRASFHTMGLGLDVSRLWIGRGWVNVLTDFEETPSARTCEADAQTARGARALRITCATAQPGLFQSVLTPNYNAGHRNHWHLDVRPDDPRLFLR